MKKVLFAILLCAFSISASAQIFSLRATSYSDGSRNDEGTFVWNDGWEKSSIGMTFNFDNGSIVIYSQREQNYVILGKGEEMEDENGAFSMNFRALNVADDEIVKLRFRKQTDDIIQLYVFYSQDGWVYSDLKLLENGEVVEKTDEQQRRFANELKDLFCALEPSYGSDDSVSDDGKKGKKGKKNSRGPKVKVVKEKPTPAKTIIKVDDKGQWLKSL